MRLACPTGAWTMLTGGVGQDAYSLVLGVVMLVSLLAPVLAPVLALVVLAHARCRDLTYRHVAALLGCVAVFVYGYGVWSSHLWDLRGADEYCGGDVARAPMTLLLPLVHTCYLTVGTTRPLVPAFVNPALLACLVGSAVVLARGRRRLARQRRDGP